MAGTESKRVGRYQETPMRGSYTVKCTQNMKQIERLDNQIQTLYICQQKLARISRET